MGAAAGAVIMVGLPVATAGAATSKAPITIGIVSDNTGAEASIGSAVPAAIEARFDLQNASGGIDGHKIVAVVGDTATSPVQAENAAAIGNVGQ